MFQMKNPPVRLLPFFILTENSDLATEYEYRHEGVNDYITSPVNIPELIRRVLFFVEWNELTYSNICLHSGEKIKHFRNLRGISQETLGQLSGINSATIKKYEYGIRNPKPDQLLKIANALGISINVFMDFDIETVSDVLSLILKKRDTRTEVSIPLQSKYPLRTPCSIISWAYIWKQGNCRRTFWMIRNASRQRKNTNGRLKHSQKIWTLLSRVFLMTVKLSKKALEVSPLKYIPKINHSHYAEK